MFDVSPTRCPTCTSVRKAQGFTVDVDPNQPLCVACATAKADKDYVESAAYRAWVASIPKTSIETAMAWVQANPPPSRS